MRHHTKSKGDLGVLKAQLALFKKGFDIFIPISEHLPFDLIAYKDKRCYRVQVKHKKVVKGVINIQFATSWADKNGSHSKQSDKDEVDFWCIYCPNNDECYFVNPKDFNCTCALRIDKPIANKGNIGSRYNMAIDYMEVPEIPLTGVEPAF